MIKFTEASDIFSDLTSPQKKMIEEATEYLEETWKYSFEEFFSLADETPEEFLEIFDDKSPEETKELIDEIVDQKVYSAQRAYVTSLAEHNRSAP